MTEQHSKSPLVSVIVPTYNGAARIGKTLKSIIAQDYPNIEIILVNDVSTDDTVNVAQRVLTEGGRPFKIIEREENGGQSAARNTGLDAAQGRYVIFFDHDDLAERNFVSLLCDEAEKKNADMVFCGYRCYFEKDDKYIDYPIPLSHSLLTAEDYLKAWLQHEIILGYVWCFIFKKNFLDRTGLRFPDGCRIGEDIEFVIKALSLNPCVSFVKALSYIYVIHSDQQTRANLKARVSLKGVEEFTLSHWRTGRCMAKHAKSKQVRSYALNYYLPDVLVKRFTLCAQGGERERYDRMLRILHHRQIRGMLFSTVRYFFTKPERVFKAFMLLYFPKLYYRLRTKKYR